jgi:hypothetical protein
MMSSFLFAIAAFVSSIAPPTAAAAASDQAIVIQGIRDRRKPADDFLKKMMPTSFDDQLGRFEEPVCPGTIGLPDKLKDEVLARIRRVATAAAIRAAREGCRPNLMIIVVDDKKALIEGMQRKKEAYLYGIGDGARKRLATSAGSVAAWQISDVIGPGGEPLRVDGDGFPRLFTTIPPSRLRSGTRSRILGAIIVVEQRGLVRVTTRQLADFALVRALAPIQARIGRPPDTSVLSLFNTGVRPEDAPQSLTWWDLALLKALASTPSDALADIQKHEIRDHIVEEMTKVPPEQR